MKTHRCRGLGCHFTRAGKCNGNFLAAVQPQLLSRNLKLGVSDPSFSRDFNELDSIDLIIMHFHFLLKGKLNLICDCFVFVQNEL